MKKVCACLFEDLKDFDDKNYKFEIIVGFYESFSTKIFYRDFLVLDEILVDPDLDSFYRRLLEV